MTYEEAKKELSKVLPKGRHSIQQYIIGLKNQDLADKLCAKWFACEAKAIAFLEQPEPPVEWIEFKAAREYKTDAWKQIWNLVEVQDFIKRKTLIDSTNHGNFIRMKIVIGLLDHSETKAKEFLRDKMKHFLHKVREQKEPPFPLYDYDPKRTVHSNN